MKYTLQNNSDIKIKAGDMVEVLESFYCKYADEIILRRIRINDRVYEGAPLHQSTADIMPVKSHEGYVDGFRRKGEQLFINLSLIAVDELSPQKNHKDVRTRH